LYCEVGWIENLRDLGAKVDMQSVNGSSKVVLVRNKIDYKSSARIDQFLHIFTRTSFIRNSSFAMESLIENAQTGELVGTNVAYYIWCIRSPAPQ
jgi:acyl-CoA thioesterase FadM